MHTYIKRITRCLIILLCYTYCVNTYLCMLKEVTPASSVCTCIRTYVPTDVRTYIRSWSHPYVCTHNMHVQHRYSANPGGCDWNCSSVHVWHALQTNTNNKKSNPKRSHTRWKARLCRMPMQTDEITRKQSNHCPCRTKHIEHRCILERKYVRTYVRAYPSR
jgi:hypothetical protein